MHFLVRFVSMLILFFLSINAFADETKTITDLLNAFHYVAQHENDVWPGFQINNMPIIIQFEDSFHTYAFHFTPKNTLWKKMKVGNETIYYMENDALNLANSLDDFNQLDGTSVLVYQIENNDTQDDIDFNIRNLIEKRFSYYLVNDSKYPRNLLNYWNMSYNGFNQLENVEYIYLEDSLLKDYLLKNDLELLKNYLAVHHMRYQMISEQSQHYENMSDIRFGISAYVGFKALNMSPTDYRREVFYIYQSFLNCPAYSTVQEIEFCTLLGHYYLTGPALGLALDTAAGNTWKSNIADAKTTPEMLLERLYPMTESEINLRISKAKVAYHFDVIKEKIENRLKFYENEMQEQVEQYAKQPGIEINFDYRFCQPTQYSTKFREQFDLSNAESLYTFYIMKITCITKFDKLELEFKQIPFLYKLNSILNVKFKVPVDTIVALDGKNQMLSDFVKTNYNMPFHQLIINSPKAIIKIKGSGHINQTNGHLEITPQRN